MRSNGRRYCRTVISEIIDAGDSAGRQAVPRQVENQHIAVLLQAETHQVPEQPGVIHIAVNDQQVGAGSRPPPAVCGQPVGPAVDHPGDVIQIGEITTEVEAVEARERQQILGGRRTGCQRRQRGTQGRQLRGCQFTCGLRLPASYCWCMTSSDSGVIFDALPAVPKAS